MEKIDFKKQSIPFTQVANGVLNDSNLSFNAKGLYAYLYSKPDGWYFSSIRISQDSKDGKKHVRTGLKELEECGYLYRQKLPNGRVLYKLVYPPVKPESIIGTLGEEPELIKATVPKSHSAAAERISNTNNISNKEYISNKDKPMSANADAFNQFWSKYPKKELKKRTQEIWQRKKLDSQLVVILEFITRAENTDRWRKGFIKQPPAFLNGECWNDDLASYGSSATKAGFLQVQDKYKKYENT